MKVSIVIPVYNRKNLIRECLESVLSQDFKDNHEVIVVDDGSTDGTAEVLKEFSSRVKLHFNGVNQGVSYARNQGILLSHGQFVAMIDSDCIASPHWLSQLTKAFEQDKNIMIVGGKVGDIALNYWQMVSKGSNFVSHHSGYVKQVIGCNMAFRREFITSHSYDQRLKFAAGDDTELCWRCKKLGFKVYYTSNAIVLHHHRRTLKGILVQRFLYGYINTYTNLKFHEFPCVNYGSRLIVLIFLFFLIGCAGFSLGFKAAAASILLFSFLPLHHSNRPTVKNLYELVITYPGNYLRYGSFCIGALIYFLIPRVYLKPPDRICIGLSSDDNYAPFMGVTLHSMLKNNPQEYFDIFIMNAGINLENIDKINLLLKDFPNAKINWITCDASVFSGLKVDNYISLTTYYRIYLPEFIPESYDKCLYFDSDTLILGRIRPLWETDLGNYALAAVQDPGESDRAEVLGLPSLEKYFNAGVALINLKYWRNGQIAGDVINFIRKNPDKIMYWDQDGLNAILYDRWKPLNEKWNKIAFTFFDYGRPIAGCIKGKDLITGPSIIHFAYKNKPWLKESTDPLRFIYFKYLHRTPWKHLIHQQENLYDAMVQWCSYCFPLPIYILLIKIKGKLQGLIKEIYKSTGLDIFIRLLKRKITGVDKHLIMDYGRKQAVKKLHIGCENHILKGWLNSDLSPSSKDVLYLDATKPFPLESNSFNYVFSEHMIEHIPYPQGLQMLKECYRVLKVNGKIRISTPNLAFLIDLYKVNTSEFQKQYIKWASEAYVGNVLYDHAIFIINNYVRNWGHQFIYDEELLRESLRQAGFSMIVKCELKESGDEILRNLENETRLPAGFLKLETMTVEGTKIIA